MMAGMIGKMQVSVRVLCMCACPTRSARTDARCQQRHAATQRARSACAGGAAAAERGAAVAVLAARRAEINGR
jgi:hypothetical protein